MADSTYKMSIHALLAAEPLATPVTPQRRQVVRALPLSPDGSISPVTVSSKVKPTRVPRKRKRKPVVGPKKPRKSRVVFAFSLELLEQYFHLSQRDAATQLGVSTITMKRNCKRLHIMWPYRSNKLKAANNRVQTPVANAKQTGTSSRERGESLSVSEADSEREKDNDGDDVDEQDEEDEDDEMSDAEAAATAAVTQPTAELSLQPSVSSGTALHTDAALVFARLPSLCLAEDVVQYGCFDVVV